jgi:hypothetical protein
MGKLFTALAGLSKRCAFVADPSTLDVMSGEQLAW